DFLEKEVVPEIGKHYFVSDSAGDRLMVGASMGGLISTYAVLTRPHFVAQCGAQSPAYRQADSAVIKRSSDFKGIPGSVMIQTGTINDTQPEAMFVAGKLKDAGCSVWYEEIHEGHNWTNWKRNLPKILTHFFGR